MHLSRANFMAAVALVLSLQIDGLAQSDRVVITMGTPGTAMEQRNMLLIALSLVNEATTTADDVEVRSVRLQRAGPIRPRSFPVKVGRIPAKQRAIVQTAFSRGRLTKNQTYSLEVSGTYVLGEKRERFTARQLISLPPPPGSSRIQTAEAASHEVSGAPYPLQEIAIPEEVNRFGRPVPIGRSRGNLMPATPATAVEPAHLLPGSPERKSSRSGQGAMQGEPQEARIKAAAFPFLAPNDVVFVRDTLFGGTGGLPNDPSGASGGVVSNGSETVLASGNTYASFSKDGGSSFTQLDPTKIFPNFDGNGKMIDGGLCCDQVIHYSPKIDRFLWLMQFRSGANGQNRLRLAAASPQSLIASGGTAWTYWDMTSALFNLGGHLMDYPDLSIGNNFAYVSVDATNVDGLLVVRIPLTELRDGKTIHIGYTNPADGQSAYGVHLIQNPGDEIFWAGHPDTSTLRVYSLKEGSNNYSWRDIAINSYPLDYTSNSPDGTNWLASLFSGGPGGTRIFGLGLNDEVWFEWMGGRGGGFPQAHIQLVRLRHSDLSVIEQTQIWNAGFAFGYASFTTNVNGAVGVSLGYGGGNFYGSPAVGFMGDGTVYSVCGSTANAGRYGDYATIREAFPNGALFSAEGYCVTPPGIQFHPHYVVFGRSGDVNPPPIGRIERQGDSPGSQAANLPPPTQ